MARIDCHFRDDGTFVTLPDEWLGVHQIRHDKVIESLVDKNYPPKIHDFIVSMALLDDWQLPGMPANPSEWDVEKVPNNVMVWVFEVVYPSYKASFIVPKKKSPPSLNGQPEAVTMTQAPGTSETTAPLVG